MRPKFHLYKADVAVISGIAWDHMNVFPTFENYKDQFDIFINSMEEGGVLYFCEEDPEVVDVVKVNKSTIDKHPYGLLDYTIENGVTYLFIEDRKYPIEVFGKHNIQNIHAAM